MTVCETIDCLLEKKHMSRRQLAIAAGIPPSTLQSALSRNKEISLDMLEKLAQALNVSIASLMPERLVQDMADYAMQIAERNKTLEREGLLDGLSQEQRDRLTDPQKITEDSLTRAWKNKDEIIKREAWKAAEEILVEYMDGLSAGYLRKSVQKYFDEMNTLGQIVAVKMMETLTQQPDYRPRPTEFWEEKRRAANDPDWWKKVKIDQGTQETASQRPEKALYTSTRDKSQEEAETPQNEPQGQKDGPKQEPEEQ